MIEINHLVKKYGNHTAVDDLSITIEDGRIYGFLGPNGAGKSTTMNILTGYLGASSGEIKVNGHDIFKEPEEAKKCIGYLPELPPLYVDMTVEEYLNFAAELKQIEKAKRGQMIEEAMELTKITEMSKRLIRNLSKGYKQRVGLAQAVLGYPEVIILDEPTVGLDPKQIIEIRELIKELGKKHTVILSSHILTEVKEVCDYIFIISKGRLVANDETENLMTQMNGENDLELIVKGCLEVINDKLREMEEIEQFEVHPTNVENEYAVHIETGKQVDIREKVFWAMAEEKQTILEIHKSGKSLEDIFLELTSAENKTTLDKMKEQNAEEEEQEHEGNI